MARKSGGRWYAITPGRLAPSSRRALGVLLGNRHELPPALVAELDACLAALEAVPPREAVPAATPGTALRLVGSAE